MDVNVPSDERGIFSITAIVANINHRFRKVLANRNVTGNVTLSSCIIGLGFGVEIDLKEMKWLRTCSSEIYFSPSHLIRQFVAEFVYKSTGSIKEVTGVIMGHDSNHRVILALSEIHYLFVDNSNIQTSRIASDGQIETRQLEDGEQETEDNSSEKRRKGLCPFQLNWILTTNPGCRINCRIFFVIKAFIRFLVVI